MSDYTTLKSSREELLKKAGFTERHILYMLADEGKPQAFDIEAETGRPGAPAAK